MRAHTASLVLCLYGLTCCEPDPGPAPRAPELPLPDEAFIIGAAGAPISMFGSADDPTFASAFGALAAAGFNRYMPLFLLDETSGTDHFVYFQHTAVFGGPYGCETKNPYDSLPVTLKVVLPGNLFAPQDPSAPIDVPAVTDQLLELRTICLGEDTSRLGAVYLQDEPGLNVVFGLISDPQVPFRVESVGELASAVKAALDVPTMIVEGPLTFFLREAGVPDADIVAVEPAFWDAVDATAPHAAHYGFDIYPVDATSDLSVVAEHLEISQKRAPQALPVIVLEGAGFKTQMLDIPPGSTGRDPTRDETRAMAFISVIAGARAIYWYGLSQQSEDSAIWADVRETAADLHRYSGIFALPTTEPPISTTEVLVQAFDGGSVKWIVIANPREVAQKVTLPKGEVFDMSDERLIARPADGETLLELQPYDTRILALRSDP